MPRP
ncbi:hypothetical protein CGLO_18415 [Colletotrichum gloeosporioides Cg-14]